ncbi:STAS domain-containing protein [Rugosimonospora africana]|uniref:Polyvinylalcohol dehydrogenase n=1 Tax=Rugosimonospora africana TaxID=556532 RepID=A0A8J3QT01_9ACTN|nr:STAS domain-containing protein [Rugosimonospora africana]GIH15899.1 polyvinylalcohol dehydrogenase [Rugosimonospora africana]
MDIGTTTQFAGLLRDHRDELLKRWTANAGTGLRGRLAEAELARQIRELYDALRGTVVTEGELTLDSPAAVELRAVLGELSRQRALHGFTATETAISVFALKEAVLGVLDAGESGSLRLFVAVSQFVDELGLFTFEAYSRTREALIAEQAEQLLELSTPVVKLWDGVVAVPLVGTLDSARAQVVMERLLQTLVDTGSPYAIIDITGVPAVDTQVAQHILKTVVAARLMGADCVISGIRPQIAQTIVALGIEFGDIVTKASLADALMHTLRAGGFELNRRAVRRD